MNSVKLKKSIVAFTSVVLVILVGHPLSYAQKVELIYFGGDAKPMPVGGKEQLKSLIKNELEYPIHALSAGVEGEAYVAFRLDQKGNVLDSKLLSAPDDTMGIEALRLFRKVVWKPNKFLTEDERVLHQFKLTFSVKSYNRLCKKRGYQSIIYPVFPIDDTETIYPVRGVEVRPKAILEDTTMSYNTFISKNYRYPESAKTVGITGKVTVAFVIEQSGRVSNVHVVNSLEAGCDAEAIRLVQLVPWVPAQNKDMAVRSLMTYTVNFGQSGSGYETVPEHQSKFH